MKKIIIIGGGASALMLASSLPKNSVTIIESNPKLGAKLLISGGGKCNITNNLMGTEYYLGDSSFIEPSLKTFTQESLIKWLNREGLYPEIRDKSQYFCRDSAQEILDIFKKNIKNQQIILSQKVLGVTKRDNIFYVKTDKKIYRADSVVVASGGVSYPKIGASGIGYDIASSFGHNIIKTSPALVGFTVQKKQFFFKELSGLSTNVKIKINNYTFEGNLLFAHKGVTGLIILDVSLYWTKGQIEINFLPNFSFLSFKGSKKQISSILPMPKRLSKAFLIQLQLEDKPFNKLKKDELEKLQSLSSYYFAPAGTFGYTKAEATKGGVDTSEIDRNTMMSKKEDGLYFIGEVLNVTGRVGGYNFQWAFSSAYSCANSIKRKKNEN